MSTLSHILTLLAVLVSQAYLIRKVRLHERNWQVTPSYELPEIRKAAGIAMVSVCMVLMLTCPTGFWISVYAAGTLLSTFIIAWLAEEGQKQHWASHDYDFIIQGFGLSPFGDEFAEEYKARHAMRSGHAA